MVKKKKEKKGFLMRFGPTAVWPSGNKSGCSQSLSFVEVLGYSDRGHGKRYFQENKPIQC